MADYIPREFYHEILLRLPAKSVCRFRTVCKLFNSIITSKSFIDSHINQNLSTDINNHLLVKIVNEYDNTEEYMFRNFSLGAPSLPATPILNSKLATHKIVGICHGLICLMDEYDRGDREIVLWNPSIRKCVVVPDWTIGLKFPGDFAIGFGSDSSNNDYKIVRVVFPVKGEVSGVEVEVFSLRTGEWRRVEGFGLNCFLPAPLGSFACVNDHTHWIGWRKDGKPRSLIMSFDMHHELFQELSLPLDLDSQLSFDLGISVSRGCLAVITNAPSCQRYFGLWVMKEYGVVESWTLLFNVDKFGMSSEASWFSKSDTVMVRSSPTTWGIYDPENERMMYRKFSESGSLVYVDKYEESLVLLNHQGLRHRP